MGTLAAYVVPWIITYIARSIQTSALLGTYKLDMVMIINDM